MKRLPIYIFPVLLLASVTVRATTTDTAAIINHVLEGINKLKDVSYKYTLKSSFPSGQTDQLTGEAYMNIAGPFLANDNDAFTAIYDGHWMYHADHRKKELTIVNADKQKSKSQRKQQETPLPKMVAAFFGDKDRLAKARIATLIEENGLEKIELKFPADVHIDAIDITLNSATNTIVEYNMYTFQPTEKTGKTTKGIKQKIKCTSFVSVVDKSRYKISDYFTIDHGKVILKKYNNYKLIAKI